MHANSPLPLPATHALHKLGHDLALARRKRGISTREMAEVFCAVADWNKTGRQLQVKAATLNAYASAFEHPLMEDAKRVLD